MLHTTLSSSLPLFHISIISQFVRSDPISHIPPSLVTASVFLFSHSPLPLLMIHSLLGFLSVTHFLFLFAWRGASSSLLCLLISFLHRKCIKDSSQCSPRVLSMKISETSFWLHAYLQQSLSLFVRACTCHPVLAEPWIFCYLPAHCSWEIWLNSVWGHANTRTHTLWGSPVCVIHPHPLRPEHSLHHLLFSFNKTPLHYPITSKTISSSFIFFSSIPPSASYLIVPPARLRSPLWEM